MSTTAPSPPANPKTKLAPSANLFSLFGDDMDSTGKYQANAYTPQTQAKVNTGTLTVLTDGVRFESATVNGTLPMAGLVVRRGGHNGEQVFFEHPQMPGWSIYSSDPALSRDPLLRVQPDVAKQLRGAERSRKSTPAPVKIALFLLALFFGSLVLLWTQKDRIAEYIANKIPVEWETKFGDQMFRQFESEGKILKDSVWDGPMSNITARLLPIVEKSGYEFKFHILSDTNVNAFAIPGGHVVILTGLLETADSAEEIAGVLAHELAHVTRRHSLRNIIKSAGLVVTLQALIGDASGLFGLATEASRYLLQQKFSRDFEREADETGWSYLVAANIDPRGMTRFFEKMREMIAKSGMASMEGSLSLVNTHPTSQERIDRLTRKWDAMPKKDGFVTMGPWRNRPRKGQGNRSETKPLRPFLRRTSRCLRDLCSPGVED
jgi:beta-barrel assembly-enhancing protease